MDIKSGTHKSHTLHELDELFSECHILIAYLQYMCSYNEEPTLVW